MSSNEEDDQEYSEVGEDGIHRQRTERSWTIRYVPDTTAASIGDTFTFPILTADQDGTLEMRSYQDMDLVPVESGRVSVSGGLRSWAWVLILVLIGVGIVGVIALFFVCTRLN